MAEQALLVLEAPSELEYLVQAPALRDVRGAAALLENLNRFVLPSLARRRGLSGAGIASGGRRYIATFPEPEAARRFAAEAHRTYRSRTVALGARTVVEPVDAEALLAAFGVHLRAARLRLERDGEGAAAAAVYAPELRLCDGCRLFPASQLSDGAAICRACVARRTQSTDELSRLQIPGYRLSLADASEEDLAARPAWERFLRWARDAGLQRSGDAAADIQALAAQRAPDDADLADSNGTRAFLIGQINDYDRALEYLNDSQRTLRMAARVNRLLDEALFEAAATLCWRDMRAPLRFEILLAGGDRFVAVFPGECALAVAARCLRTFEGQSAAATEGRRLSIALGVGLASAALPLTAAALAARRALGAASAEHQRASDAPARGSWRSVAGIGSVDGAPRVLNAGELERALAHARTLRRHGVTPTQLLRLEQAGRDGHDGALAVAAAGLGESQRRAVAAVWRDLEGGDGQGLFPALRDLLAVAGPDLAPMRSRAATAESGRVS